ncbi:acyl carrier protein [Streptomyces sp. SID486]|uniref:acyl carrier protein n=1 Tax=unclassified Streptomyces TaxID=2593676 RepID=UPI00136CC99D|nr:acyl carrier protein [Streptomyces sp. SID486]MYW16098.1 acyl carrier protein [Streptomyces sp. SID2955]MYX99286.1 acyl carrier protein [Streptomyces sp. SID486]
MGSDVIEQVRSWLLARNPEVTTVGWDEDLIDSRLIDSLDFPQLLLLLEELAGRELELTAENVVAFRTLRGIRDTVLAGSPGADAVSHE